MIVILGGVFVPLITLDLRFSARPRVCCGFSAELVRHGDVARAAEHLTRRAIEDLGSRDNVTVLVVMLAPRGFRPTTAPAQAPAR